MKQATTPYGITGFGGYIPRLRMQRSAIASAHKWMAPALRSLGKGQRAFCSWDEDAITMAVEAARDALDQRPVHTMASLGLASTTLPFADMQNTAVVTDALALPATVMAQDLGGSQRAGTTGLLAALKRADGNALFIASDRPRGKPASTQEISYGAGAAAFTLGSEGVVATLLGAASHTAMFVDHFRSAEAKYDYVWEERWIRDEGYAKIVPDAVAAALKNAGVAAADVGHFILGTPMKGIAATIIKKVGIPAQAEANALDEHCGYAGAAHSLLMLAHTLETAVPGDIVAVVGFGQGVDVLVFKVTEAITSFKPRRGVSGALADAQTHDDYLRMLSYDNGIDLEWGMRAEKVSKAPLTEQYRSAFQLGHFHAGKCPQCGTIQFPQLAYCVSPACHAPAGDFEQLSLVDEPCQVLTSTADWLSYHPAPPLYVGFVQFNNGARLLMESVDVGEAGLETGMPLRVTFRIKDIDRTRGYPRYFWKTTPVQA